MAHFVGLQSLTRNTLIGATVAAVIVAHGPYCRVSPTEVIHPGGPTAATAFAHFLLDGSERQFQELFRLNKAVFRNLCEWLKKNTLLHDTRYQSAEQKVMIFLWILSFDESQRNAAHRFGVAQSTISTVVHEMLPYFIALFQEEVTLPPDGYISPEIALNPKLCAFQGCIGAIDGTHIHARIPADQADRWRGRKGYVSQNVFAAVQFDGRFSYVLAGAEGSINDSRLLTIAMIEKHFHVPDNRYYLADAGFGGRKGIIVPFAGTLYHLQDWRKAGKKPKSRKELYNHRHSSARVKVEQAFGWLKHMFKIIRRSAPEYDLETQMQLLYAAVAVYNFKLSQSAVSDEVDEDEAEYLEEAKERADRYMARFSSIGVIQVDISRKIWKQYNRQRRGIEETDEGNDGSRNRENSSTEGEV